LNTFNFNHIIENSSALYLGARKIEEIGDYGISRFEIFLFQLIILDGNVSVQKKFVRKEFNFGLQERFTGTDLPVEENDFKTEPMNSNNSNIKCVS
jgi:hypothetical protein